MILPFIQKCKTYPYSPSILRSDLSKTGLNVSSSKAFKLYMKTLCGSNPNDAAAVIPLWGKIVCLLGPTLFAKTIFIVLGQSTTTVADGVTAIVKLLEKVSKISPPDSGIDFERFELEGKKLEPRFEVDVFLERLLTIAASSYYNESMTTSDAISFEEVGGEIDPAKISSVLIASKIPKELALPESDSYNHLLNSLTGVPRSVDNVSQNEIQDALLAISYIEQTVRKLGVDAFLASLPIAIAIFESSERPSSPTSSLDSLPCRSPSITSSLLSHKDHPVDSAGDSLHRSTPTPTPSQYLLGAGMLGFRKSRNSLAPSSSSLLEENTAVADSKSVLVCFFF